MKVKCLRNNVSDDLDDKVIVYWASRSDLEITTGNVYVILAITKQLDNIFYYVLGDGIVEYPLAFPANLFEIIDDRVSEYWDSDLNVIDQNTDIDITDRQIISFREWVISRDSFYERLLDSFKEEQALFNYERDRMLNEFQT